MSGLATTARDPLARSPATTSEIAACCNVVYGHPLAEALVGESFHPGGLDGTRRLLAAADLAPRARLLDIGCGLGASARLAAAEFDLAVDAIDVSPTVLARALERSDASGIEWRGGDVTGLQADDASYDAVLTECVLAAVPREVAVAEIARVLKPGGAMLISDVAVSGDPIAGLEQDGAVGAALCVTSAWRPGEFDRLMRSARLEVTRRWDRSEDVLRLIDRVEGRLVVARSLLTGSPSRDQVEMVTTSLRQAVADGRLVYFAAIARRDSLSAAV